MSRFAVLGCGPAGMMVAHAVALAGHDVHIYSEKKRSPIGGAQYLHTAIPELTTDAPDGEVEFVKKGSAQGYAAKIYNDIYAPTSWDTFPSGSYKVWNLQGAYEKAWGLYSDLIIDSKLAPTDLFALVAKYDGVLSCIPLKSICRNVQHKFHWQTVWIGLEAPDHLPNHTIVYNGELATPWYRMSKIFGHGSTEWPLYAPPSTSCVKVRKPLRSNCDCWPEVGKFGRYGSWKKEMLTHHAFEKAQQAMEEFNAR